jgi:hypothetical protein
MTLDHKLWYRTRLEQAGQGSLIRVHQARIRENFRTQPDQVRLVFRHHNEHDCGHSKYI